jgi:hypothetical protein
LLNTQRKRHISITVKDTCNLHAETDRYAEKTALRTHFAQRKKGKRKTNEGRLYAFQQQLLIVPVNGEFCVAMGIFAAENLLNHVGGNLA